MDERVSMVMARVIVKAVASTARSAAGWVASVALSQRSARLIWQF